MRISDWSSDVGSSDLETPYRRLLQTHGFDPRRPVMVEDMARNLGPAAALGMTTVWVPTAADRSEERRVGKECDRTRRSRGSPYTVNTNRREISYHYQYSQVHYITKDNDNNVIT